MIRDGSLIGRLCDMFARGRDRVSPFAARDVAGGDAFRKEVDSLPRADGFTEFELIFEHTGEKHAISDDLCLSILADDRPPPRYLPRAAPGLPASEAHRVRPDLYRKEEDSSQLYHQREVRNACTPHAVRHSRLVAALQPMTVTVEAGTLTCHCGSESVSLRNGRVVAAPAERRALGIETRGDELKVFGGGVNVYVRGRHVVMTRQELRP